MRSASLAAMTLLLGGGCVLAVDVDDYTFDRDPCMRVAPCTGGTTYRYVGSGSDLIGIDRETGTVEGFNFDGTAESICGKVDYTSASGEPGIDNQVVALAALDAVAELSYADTVDRQIVAGEAIQLFELLNVDSLEEDGCVAFRTRVGSVPAGVDLDPDGNGRLDDGEPLTLDAGPTTWQDLRACIHEGQLHARIDGESLVSFAVADVHVDRLRFRARVSETALTDGALGGAIGVAELVRVTSEGGRADLEPLIASQADLDPTPDGCLSIGWAFSFEAIDVNFSERPPIGP